MSARLPPLRILLAGAGAFGREHLARLVARSDASVVGLADANPAAVAAACAHYGIAHGHSDPLRLIDETDAEAIIVATPADSHVEICRRALERDLAVLLEKPIAPSAASAAPLVAAERTSNGFVLPGHVLRHSKEHRRLIDIVRSGEIGEALYVNSRRYRDESHALRYPHADPILMTLIHDIDLAQWVTGASFRSVLARRVGRGFRSMTATCAVTTTGVACDLRTAWTFADGDLPPDSLEMVGDRGSVELLAGRALRVYAKGVRADFPIETDDPLRNEHDHFLSCARNRAHARALDLSQAIIGLKLADAAMESLRSNREAIVSP